METVQGKATLGKNFKKNMKYEQRLTRIQERDVHFYYKEGRNWLVYHFNVGKTRRKLNYSVQRKTKLGYRENFL